MMLLVLQACLASHLKWCMRAIGPGISNSAAHVVRAQNVAGPCVGNAINLACHDMVTWSCCSNGTWCIAMRLHHMAASLCRWTSMRCR